jgi:hypothetical protein
MNTQIEQEGKAYIDADIATTHPQNDITSFSGKVDPYYGWWYEVLNQWNLSGTADYPVKIIGTYTIQNKWRQTNIELTATSDADRIAKSNQILSQIQWLIRAWYNSCIPSYSRWYIIDGGTVAYRWYSYSLFTTMNLDGNCDYPAAVYVRYTTPLSNNNVTLTINARDATELTTVRAERINDAKARIDLIVDNDLYPANYVETITNTTSYWGGSYRTAFTYSGNPWQDYPGYVDTYITYQNGSSDKLTITAANANQKSTYASNLETQARSQIDNYNPIYSTNYIGSDGPHLHGTRWGDYTVKVQYNRTGQNKNYPVMIWIEYRMRSGGPLLDTRNIVGIWAKYAYSSTEKDQIKDTLIETVKGKMTASTGISPIQYARDVWSHIGNMLISPAHAATPPSIVVKNNYASVPNYSYIDPNTVAGKFLAYNGNVLDHIVGNKPGKSAVAGGDKSKLALQKAITEIWNSTDKITQYWGQCSVWWEMILLWAWWCTSYFERLQKEENGVRKSIWAYLQSTGEAILPTVSSTANYMYGLWDGAAASIYAMRDLWVNIIDGTTLQQISNWYTTKMYPYFYENGFDFMTYWWDESRVVLWLEASIGRLIWEVIWLETDPYKRGYLIGSIWSAIAMWSILGTAADAAVIRMKSLGQLVATIEATATTPKALQLLGTLRAKMVQEVVSKFTTISSVDDIQAIAWANTLPNLTQKAYILIGTEETAQGVANFLKNKNWIIDGTNPKSITYTSPNWLERINYRIIASSEVPGYETRVTFDLLRKVGNQFKAIPWGDEVKFVFPKK